MPRTQDPPRPPCRNCGCEAEVHEHFHDRTYCGRCGSLVCNRYLPPPWLLRTLASWLR